MEITTEILNQAKEFFIALRDRLYRLPETIDESIADGRDRNLAAQNCAAKTLVLMEHLDNLSFKVNMRVIEFSWAEMKLPNWIVSLWPPQYPVTHVYLELEYNKELYILDASWDRALAEALGYRLAEWGEKKHAGLTPIGNPYTDAQRDAHFAEFTLDYTAKYFKDVAPFMKAANQWLAEQRQHYLQSTTADAEGGINARL